MTTISEELKNNIRKQFKNNGIKRIEQFVQDANITQHSKAKTLKQDSIDALEEFLTTHKFIGFSPLVFLSKDGNIVIDWMLSDYNLRRFSIEFKTVHNSVLTNFDDGSKIELKNRVELSDVMTRLYAVTLI